MGKTVKRSGRSKESGEGRIPHIEVWVIAVLNRYLWNRFPARLQVKTRCRVKVKVGEFKNGKDKIVWKFKCEECGDIVDKIEVDHLEPRIDPEKGYEGIENWIYRTFVEADKLKGKCKPCHTEKTVSENAIRRESKRETDRKPAKPPRRKRKKST